MSKIFFSHRFHVRSKGGSEKGLSGRFQFRERTRRFCEISPLSKGGGGGEMKVGFVIQQQRRRDGRSRRLKVSTVVFGWLALARLGGGQQWQSSVRSRLFAFLLFPAAKPIEAGSLGIVRFLRFYFSSFLLRSFFFPIPRENISTTHFPRLNRGEI